MCTSFEIMLCKFVKDNFATEHRGKVAAKNKGQVEMYFVEYK
ncbi:MAG: hypothetical protein ACJAUD_002839 [Crocinitomicaceae bacterium]|jgi:hypothetical protein